MLATIDGSPPFEKPTVDGSAPHHRAERTVARTRAAHLDATPQIERWFRLEWQEHTPPFYCSVDLRNAGFKLAPVDTNLFPGGFNNLSPEMLPLAVQAAMAAIEKYCPDARNLLLIPENPHAHALAKLPCPTAARC
jgi:hypothetical protein